MKIKNFWMYMAVNLFGCNYYHEHKYKMTEQQLTLLIRKYLSGEATEEEKAEVEQWYESFDKSALKFADGNRKAMNESTARSLLAIREKIAQYHPEKAREISLKKVVRKDFSWRQMAAAAAILILLSGGFYFLFFKTNKQRSKAIATTAIKKDFKPGGNNAILTLANGKQIILDSVSAGVLSTQGNTKVIKLNNGLLAYNRQSSIVNRQSSIQYNVITTPRGGKYEVVLPDGTKVWLNAASSIRFPTTFAGKEREVQITGEAYFDVAKNVDQPFKVSVRGMTVDVLGTQFNIMAYNDEPDIKTTLVNGKVKVTIDNKQHTVGGQQPVVVSPKQQAVMNPDQQVILSPEQQVILSLSKDGQSKMKLIKDVNTNEVIAWKNNLFWFDNTNIQEIIKQLSRWYDVDIQIKGDIPDLFTGSIPRDLAFSKVFEVLQKTGSIQYKIENDKTIIVSP